MPYKINGASEHYGWDYLPGLTKLENLCTLAPDTSFDDTNLIDPKVFERASSLRHLSVHTFSPNMQALIMLPELGESLTSFEIKNYFQTTRNLLDVDDQEEHTTYPLREFARDSAKLEEASSGRVHWIGSNRAIDNLSEVVVKMPQLEELSISVTQKSHRNIKDHVLPVMPNLKNLFLI